MDEQKLLKHAAINSFVLMLMIVIISTVYSYYNNTLIFAENDNEKITNILNPNDNVDALKPNNNIMNETKEIITNNLGEKYLIIKKTNNSLLNIKLDDLYMERSITVTISGLSKDSLDNLSIVRMNHGKEYIGQPIFSEEVIETQSNNGKKQSKRKNNENNSLNDTLSNEKDTLSNEKDTFNKTTSSEEQFLVPEIITASGEILIADNTLSNNGDTQNAEEAIDPVKEFSIQYDKLGNDDEYIATMHISLDDIYAHVVYQDAENIYIDLKRPKEVYKKIVVIDAGHGGKDSGTYSRDELNYEKNVNLSIILKLKEILDKEDFKVYYTRTTDKTIFLNPRVNFANDVEADLFLSVHCNASESPEPYGSEVLYNELDKSKGFNSKNLAEICFEEIKALTKRVNRGLVYGNEMVIIGKAKMPVALAEIGFMSNQQDLNFLLKESNQVEIAEALHKTILRAFDEMEK